MANLGNELRTSDYGPGPRRAAGEFSLETSADSEEAPQGKELMAESGSPEGNRFSDNAKDINLMLQSLKQDKQRLKELLTGGGGPVEEPQEDISKRLGDATARMRQGHQEQVRSKNQSDQKAVEEGKIQIAEDAKQRLVKEKFSDTMMYMIALMQDFLGIFTKIPGWGCLMFVLLFPINTYLSIHNGINRWLQKKEKGGFLIPTVIQYVFGLSILGKFVAFRGDKKKVKKLEKD